MKRYLNILFAIVLISLNVCCYEAKNNLYTIQDENVTLQYESLISIDSIDSEILFQLSQQTERSCTEDEEKAETDILDLFFEEVLRFNYALKKATWNNIASISDELHESSTLEENYLSIDKFVKEHGADINVTSVKKTSSLCYTNGHKRIVKSCGILNCRLLSFDGYKPDILDGLTFGDNPIAYIVYIELSDDAPTSKVIGWSFKRYNSKQKDFYPEA